MSIQTEISRLQTLRNNIRTKLISLGLLSNASATLADCQTALDGVDLYTGGNTITSNGTVACGGKYMAENLTVEVVPVEIYKVKATFSSDISINAKISIGGIVYEDDFTTEITSGTQIEVSVTYAGKVTTRARIYLDSEEVANSTDEAIYTFTPTTNINIHFKIVITAGEDEGHCYITTGDGSPVNSITTSGSYDNATYHGDYWAAIDGSGNLLLVVEGGISRTYENINFTAASVPSGVSLENMTKYTSSNATGGLYAALFTGISSNVDIALDFNARNGTNDYVTCEVTITEA